MSPLSACASATSRSARDRSSAAFVNTLSPSAICVRRSRTFGEIALQTSRRSPARSPTSLVASPSKKREIGPSDGSVQRLHTFKSYFPSQDPSLGPVSRFFEGEATSEVALRAGVREDVWTAVAPDIGRLLPVIERGDDVLSGLPDEALNAALAPTLVGLTDRYTDSPPPATFRLIVSPLVTWIWLGALIVFAGASIALWPAGAGARRPATAAGLARVARELERA